MAKPSKQQTIVLDQLKDEVLEQMKTIGFENEARLRTLNSIPLAVLRRNATQRHGVTRFRRGANASELKTEDVETVDLHPMLLDSTWHNYARFVLYHEYLHALGNRFHDATFRRLEQLWPQKGAERGREFTQFLRHKTASWLWICTTCDNKYPRKRRANGRFRCRACSTILVDLMNTQETN